MQLHADTVQAGRRGQIELSMGSRLRGKSLPHKGDDGFWDIGGESRLRPASRYR
jgi:hypothetical protein